ncbi:DUF6183 family protein [Streptosporangium sp. NPDC051022]|uniref:DUF6183 family protein n=1 Tax=Streptosporangium sp. NPDC051022 TaxID=3155752 RepID=UPI003425A8C9
MTTAAGDFMVSGDFRRGLRKLALSRAVRDVEPLAVLIRDRYAAGGQVHRIRDLAALLAARERPFERWDPLFDEWEPLLDRLPIEQWEPVLGLLPFFERVPDRPDMWAELIACLAQELVAHGADLTLLPAALRCAAALRKLGHPLARLPLRPVRGERELLPPRTWSDNWEPPRPPHYDYGSEETGLEKGMTFSLSGSLPGSPPGRDSRFSHGGFGHGAPRRVSTPGQERLIAAAVERWGRPHAAMIIELPRRFGREEPVPPGVDVSLPDRYGGRIRLRGHPARLEGVVGELFGNAYCDVSRVRGLRAGYGRLQTWRSVAGLVRAPGGASVYRIGRLAARWRWMTFVLSGRPQDWMQGMIAVGAIGPRGDVLSLLVSTSD